MMITHDCDIPAEDKELTLEFIVCDKVKADPQFLNSRNVRTLHLPYQSGAETTYYQVNFQNRQLVERELFNKFGDPEESLGLRDEDKRVLKQWLSTRYGRPGYPNSFENRLRKKTRRKTTEWHIAKILEPCQESLCAMFISLGNDKNIELPESEPYGLNISLVYHTAGGTEAREACDRAAARILALFEEAYGPLGEATEIALESCEAVADSRFSLVDIMKADQWRLEWMSLSEEDEILDRVSV
ncbi:MAG: hypothetical protein ACRBBM_05120 [Pseudomonadaceae bacterium]